MDYTPDTHSLPDEPGAKATAGTAGKEKKVPRKTFRESIGQGTASGGDGQLEGTGGSGDPTITYKVQETWAKPLGRTGKFGTQDQAGKDPIDYDIKLESFMEEY